MKPGPHRQASREWVEPQVLVGHCAGLSMIPEKDLADYYAGYGVVAAIAAVIALIGAIAHAFLL